ncbi:MAG TPA: TIGR02996 domain-containing protein [Fimbriiglobus sp.]|jgi:uncharacterized protein (TIGR02996 family)|nr:TIGR02996 domain-containing protein [Fimbriiglobus sp.]
MTDRDALLAAVIARPEDDLPRLVFADWLDEHGEHDRAAFVRAQIEAEALPPLHPDREPLEEFSAALLRTHRADWDRELPEWTTWRGTKVVYRRGFVAELITTPRRLLRDGHELFAVAPVHSVRLRPQIQFTRRTPVLFRDHPYYARITSLRLGPRLLSVAPLRGANRDPMDIAILALAQHLNALQVLDVSDNDLTDDWMVRFAERLHLMAFARVLSVLDLSDNVLTDAGADVLASSLGFLSVRLRLRGNRLTAAGADRLRRRFGGMVEL